MNIIISALNSRHTHSAIALAYLKAFWERVPKRPQAQIVEFDINQTNEGIYSSLILQKPQLLAFSVYIWSLDRILAISSAIKAALPETIIVLGGPEVSFTSRAILQQHPFIDFIVRGEGEETFEALLSAILEKKSTSEIAGITYRAEDQVVVNPDRGLLKDMDSIPSAFQAGIFGNGGGFTFYEASRGCPSKCTYCLSSVQGHVRNHSLERVKSDLDWFFASNYRQVRFADRTFNFDKKRAIEIIEYIKERNVKGINFHFEMQADFLSDEIIGLLATAPEGMFHLEIGVQSTNTDSLSAVNRRFDLDCLKNAVRRLKSETGCHLHLDLLGGLPEDRFSDFLNSLNDVWHLAPHDIQISLVKVLRGTPLEKDVAAKRIFCMQSPPYTVLRTNWLTGEEAIMIQDMGKLVDGFYNSNRFPLSLAHIIKTMFNGLPALFVQNLTNFWRKNELQFFNFSPAIIHEKLLNFIHDEFHPEQAVESATILLEHELHLNQKVPVGDSPLGPDAETGKRKNKLKVTPGLKSFWYLYELQDILANKQNLLKGAFPIIYRFEKDLSTTPDTREFQLPLIDRFIIAALHRKVPIENLAREWTKHIPNSIALPDFSLAIDKLLQEGLLYDSREKNYQQVKDLIDKR